MAVLGLHVFLQRGLNKLQRESIDGNKFNQNRYNLMHGNNTYAQNTTFIINNPVMC